MVWYSHLIQNFPQFIVHIVKAFDIVNKAEIDVFLELSCFFDDLEDVGNLISLHLAKGIFILITKEIYVSYIRIFCDFSR